jgi:hypothetical protein
MSEELLQTQNELEKLIESREQIDKQMAQIKKRNERVEREKEELKVMLRNKAKAEDLEE